MTRYKNIIKKHGKRGLACLMAVLMAASFSACSTTGGRDKAGSALDTPSEAMAEASSVSTDEMFSERDLAGSYDTAESVTVTLDSENSSSNSDKVQITGQTVVIQDEGVYLISGTLTDGQIQIDADETDKVQLVLDGATVMNDSSAAIYAKEADKVFITLAEESENSLSTTGEYEAIDENEIDAVVFSKCDLTVNGTGNLNIDGKTGHGIAGKDDVVLSGGSLTVTAAKKAVSGNDSIRIAEGTYNITAGTDGLHAENTDDDTKGFIYVQSGEIRINAGDDGAHASGSLMVSDGSLTVENSKEGLEGHKIVIDGGQIEVYSSDDGLNAAGDSNSGNENAKDPMASDAEASIVINSGTIHINAGGDGIDSNGTLNITGGTVEVEGPENDGNGAMDVAAEAVITGGTVIASGSSGMAMNFSEKSTQGSILQNVDTATGSISLTDENGNVILSMDTEKQYSSVLISSPELKQGSTYKLRTGESETSIEMSGLIVGTGGMGGGMMRGNGVDQGKGGMHGRPSGDAGFQGNENGSVDGSRPDGFTGEGKMPENGMEGRQHSPNRGAKPAENSDLPADSGNDADASQSGEQTDNIV